jgi:hypothetical protein
MGCCTVGRLAAMVIVFLVAGMGSAVPATAAADDCAPGNPLTPQAEMFATNNTETIADLADPRLQDRLEPFASQVDLACVDEGELTRIAELVSRQFGQESVLTFTYRPDGAPSADSFIAEVPGVDVQHFHDALAADRDARTRLGGGSVNDDGLLVLVASDGDAEVAKRVVAVSGGELDMAGVRHGTSRFVP